MREIGIKSAVFLILFLVGTLSAQELQGPKIEVRQERFDMGSVVEGTQAVHVFEVRNAGTATLIIEDLQPS